MRDLLDIRDLTVTYGTGDRTVRAVDAVDLTVGAGEVVGLAGESGSGKSTLGLSLLGLLPASARVSAGAVLWDGRDLLTLTPAQRRDVRWSEISMVFQGAMNALNPVTTIGSQIAEPIRRHEGVSKAAARDRTGQLLEQVGIPRGRSSQFAHEFSGGMRQRVMIAMALACRPRLVIADEPTTALDVMTQAQVLDVLRTSIVESELSMLLISHDLSVLGDICHRTAVMYAGELVEIGPTAAVLGAAGAGGGRHPYTRALMSSYPRIGGVRRPPVGLPGAPPDLSDLPDGCRFAPRCAHRAPGCAPARPSLEAVGAGHLVACVRQAEIGAPA